jgi:hyperosmotically inducible protein
MKTKIIATCFLAATAIAPVAVHADGRDADRAHPTTFVKDSIITAKIKAKLADKKLGTLTHVSVDTDAKGRVVLSGDVKSQAEADQAVTIAKQVEGVTSVTNNLKIKKGRD